MFCPKCGTSVKDNDSYCPKCGYPLKEQNEPAQMVKNDQQISGELQGKLPGEKKITPGLVLKTIFRILKSGISEILIGIGLLTIVTVTLPGTTKEFLDELYFLRTDLDAATLINADKYEAEEFAGREYLEDYGEDTFGDSNIVVSAQDSDYVNYIELTSRKYHFWKFRIGDEPPYDENKRLKKEGYRKIHSSDKGIVFEKENNDEHKLLIFLLDRGIVAHIYYMTYKGNVSDLIDLIEASGNSEQVTTDQSKEDTTGNLNSAQTSYDQDTKAPDNTSGRFEPGWVYGNYVADYGEGRLISIEIGRESDTGYDYMIRSGFHTEETYIRLEKQEDDYWEGVDEDRNVWGVFYNGIDQITVDGTVYQKERDMPHNAG